MTSKRSNIDFLIDYGTLFYAWSDTHLAYFFTIWFRLLLYFLDEGVFIHLVCQVVLFII